MSGRAGGRAGRAGLRRGSVYRLKMAVCVALFCGPRARRWWARAGRFSAGSRTRVRGRPGVGGVPPAAHGSAPLRAPRPLGPILGLAQGRLQLPGLARRGGPGPRGQRAGGGWSRTSARAAGCLVRRFSVGDECQAFHRGGLRSPPETESAAGLFNNSPLFYLRGNRLARNCPGNRCTFQGGGGAGVCTLLRLGF